MECKIKNDLGTIYIAEDVMMKVVGYAALECYGIVAMSGKKASYVRLRTMSPIFVRS